MIIVNAVAAGLLQSVQFFWDSLFGLIFGFLISAIVQVVLTPATMERYLGPNLRGIVSGAGFGIIASACSYGASAAARGFYQRGADIRAVFSFLIASTNMNLAILILFWSLLGWKFAFAEFFGGIIIIAVVVTGLSLLFGGGKLEQLRAQMPGGDASSGDHCAHHHHCHDEPAAVQGGWTALAHPSTWRAVAETAQADVAMLRTELIVGYLVAGFAAALVPQQWLSSALQSVGSLPYVGYVALLIVGLLLAVITFVCSMGNVPIARFLANAGIPLGANTTFIYGDLLIPPLVAIYLKSFPRQIVWTFLGLFVVGAMLAGAIMERTIGDVFGGVTMGSMSLNDRITLISNVAGLLAVAFVFVASRAARSEARS